MRRLLPPLLAVFFAAGCVSVANRHNLVPPSALVTTFRAPLVMPRGEIPCDGFKVGTGKQSVYVTDWLYTGLGADVTDMALDSAVADAGITRLLYADYEQYSILGFVTVFTVTAYGR